MGANLPLRRTPGAGWARSKNQRGESMGPRVAVWVVCLVALGTVGAQAQIAGVDAQLVEDIALANRILYDQGVVDGYGHVSARHDKDPNRYLLSRSMAPALVTAADIMEYDLDSNPVDARGRT